MRKEDWQNPIHVYLKTLSEKKIIRKFALGDLPRDYEISIWALSGQYPVQYLRNIGPLRTGIDNCDWLISVIGLLNCLSRKIISYNFQV